MADLYKYNTAVHIYKPIIKRGVVDFAVSADWTPAAGDVKISKDGGAAANVTNLPTAITMGNTALWDFSLTATEMQAAKIRITVSDSATKAVEDVAFEIDTYGNASAQHAVDFSDAVRFGLTAIPNAAAEAAGGLYTRGTGAGQINQPANGMIDSNVVRNAGTAITAASGIQEVKVASVAANAISDAAVAADMDAYHAKIWVIRESTTTDHYAVIFFKNGQPVTSGITSPTIQVIKASDGSDLIASGALTEVSSLGIYKKDESTNKMTAGAIYFGKVTATIDGSSRTWLQQVGRDSA